ncbi:MAG TPA: hydantoinase/oxoprolinase family protein [Streptosporangiaceae bacterium]|nr:hydantoinase/oxoprolinase family protein [Streptosporangiaceae bacterium]
MYFVGTDTGGTFTDCAAVDDTGHVSYAKTLSTPHDLAEGVLNGLESLAAQHGLGLEDFLDRTGRMGHGSTVGTNLVVQRGGARVALVTTAGHGDALFLMRGGHARVAGIPRELVYSLHATSLPRPLVPRSRVVEIHERVDAGGTVVTPLDEEPARRALAELLVAQDIDAVAISLLWSHRNPVHELRLAALVRELAPDVYVSLSCEVAPRTGEYERTVATVINALVGPASTAYLDRLSVELTKRGLAGPLLVMQSNGGVVTPEVAKTMPLRMIDSGPAGGLSGAAALARPRGHRNVIATDMGGTSFDVGLVVRGRPVVADEQIVDQHTFLLPHLDVRSIGCGGGSIARFDPHAGSLRVGPDSAGADPGPACYGRGGRAPTVTDADVVLGLLRPDAFLGGRMPLDADAARRAVTALAEPLGMSVEETAAGIVRINNNAAATLIRQRTLEQGYDPRDFVLYAFGGAGPVHAFGFAADLGVEEVVIPLGNGASTLSAYGIAATDIAEHFDHECRMRAPFDAEEVARVVAEAERRAHTALARQGVADEGARAEGGDADGGGSGGGAGVQVERLALMRYAEQYMFGLPIPIPDGPVTAETVEALRRAFDDEYERLHGPGARVVFQALEIFNIQIRATVPRQGSGEPLPQVATPEAGSAGSDAPDAMAAAGVQQGPARRNVFWPDAMAWLDTTVHRGPVLDRGTVIAGPALVELAHTTIAVAGGQRLRADDAGGFVLSLT